MKRIILPLLTLLVASASGQNSQKGIGEQRVAPTSNPVVLHSQNASGSSSYNLNRGSEFFYEDFSNDLDGSTAFGAWTVSDNADNTIWHMANANSPEGPFVSGSDPLDSETASNGWVIFDIDAYIGDNPSWGQGDDDYTTGYLTSPELNMTDLSSVLVEFQQYFIYCCFPLSPLTVEVSIDNQESWYVFPGQGEYFDAANVFSANPQVTVVDVSCIAAFQPSVYIRFAYNSDEEAGYNQYIWGIDDVRVYENTKMNDIEVTEINTGNIVTSYEYQVIPFEQRIMEADGGLVAGATFSNRGINTQTNVTLLAEILDDADAVIYTYESDPFELTSSITSTDCPSAEYFNLFVSTGFEPTETGVYTLRVTMLGDSIDETPNNNVMMKTVEFSVDEYGHDDIDAIAGYIQTSAVAGTNPTEYNPGGWGSAYKCANQGSSAYGVAVRFGNQSANGVEFKSALIEMDGTVSLTESPTIAEEYYNMASNWHNGTYKYFPFDNSVELDTAFQYFGCIWRETQSEGRLYVGAQEEEDTDLSSAAWELGGSGEYSWFFFQPYTYSVRLIVSDRVGLDEVNYSAGLKSFNIFPNPAVTETRVNFSLEGSRSVAYEIRDLSGKLIQWQNVGDFAPGDNTFTVDVSRVASGNYFLNLVIDGNAMFSQQLNVQK